MTKAVSIDGLGGTQSVAVTWLVGKDIEYTISADDHANVAPNAGVVTCPAHVVGSVGDEPAWIEVVGELEVGDTVLLHGDLVQDCRVVDITASERGLRIPLRRVEVGAAYEVRVLRADATMSITACRTDASGSSECVVTREVVEPVIAAVGTDDSVGSARVFCRRGQSWQEATTSLWEACVSVQGVALATYANGKLAVSSLVPSDEVVVVATDGRMGSVRSNALVWDDAEKRYPSGSESRWGADSEARYSLQVEMGGMKVETRKGVATWGELMAMPFYVGRDRKYILQVQGASGETVVMGLQ